MIVADFTRAENGLRLSIEGHAGYSRGGDDVVCAAVSGIFYALCGYLANRKNIGVRIEAIGPGRGNVWCSESGMEAMRFACVGLLQIALSYPAHLAVLDRALLWRGEAV